MSKWSTSRSRTASGTRGTLDSTRWPRGLTLVSSPSALAGAARAREIELDAAEGERVVLDETGAAPRELRFVRTDEGIVAYLTLALAGDASLADAHGQASAVEERVRAAVPGVADVVVHTEP